MISFSLFLGRLHPLLVHLPIGVLLIALLLQWLSRRPGYGVSHGVLKLLWIIGAAAALFSCITGFLLSMEDSYDDTAVALHMWSGIGVALLSILLFAKVAARQFDALYKGGALLLLILIFAAGHFGGALTHGSEYLFEAFNQNGKTPAKAIVPLANVQQAMVYQQVVQPILETRCYSCHGAQKQKGKLRLDDSAFIAKGGADGKVLVAGHAAESPLMKSLLLPTSHEDHMPPKEKPQLTEGQLQLIHWWIDAGAPFSKKVADMAQPEKLKPVLAALERAETTKESVALLPAEPVAPGDTAAINALRSKGILVLPLAQGSHYLEVNFTTAAQLSYKDFALLQGLEKQILSLKASRPETADSALLFIGKCTNLRSLWLNNTSITDKGLAHLKNLGKLQTLSLAGTKITAQGLMQLKALPQLHKLFLFQTAVTRAGLPQLVQAFPKTVLDSGGYRLPLLASDTSFLKPGS